jgi:hypothetical protein
MRRSCLADRTLSGLDLRAATFHRGRRGRARGNLRVALSAVDQRADASTKIKALIVTAPDDGLVAVDAVVW